MRQNDIFKNFNLPRWATPIMGDWDPPPKQSRPYRCSRVLDRERSDVRMLQYRTLYCWDRYDNSGSRQTAAERGSFASLGTYVMSSIRNSCLDRIYDLYVKPHMYSFTKTYIFGT